MRSQGAELTRTKKGYFVKFPNGDSTTFHNTNSDNRAARNMRAVVLRAGLSWPFDARKDPGMDPRTQRTYDVIRDALSRLPEPFTMEQLLEASGKSTGPIHRYLRDYGYVHQREKGSTYWRLAEKPVPVPTPAPTPAPAPKPDPEVPSYPEIEKARQLVQAQEIEKHKNDREFLDTADSWNVTVPAELQEMATAMGLQIEVRVWRE